MIWQPSFYHFKFPLAFFCFPVLSVTEVLYPRGNQVTSQRHTANSVLVHFPWGLSSLCVLDGHHPRSQHIYVPVQLGPYWGHVLPAEHFPDQIYSVLPLYSGLCSCGRSQRPLTAEMCHHLLPHHWHVEVRYYGLLRWLKPVTVTPWKTGNYFGYLFLNRDGNLSFAFREK